MKLKKIGQKAYLKQCCLKTKLRHTTPSCSCFVILQNSNHLSLFFEIIFLKPQVINPVSLQLEIYFEFVFKWVKKEGCNN